MAPQQLKALIFEQPEGSAIRAAFSAGDQECANALNRNLIDGYIPRRHMLVVLFQRGLIPTIRSIAQHRLDVDGNKVSAGLLSTCIEIDTVIQLESDDLRTPIDARLKAGCIALAPMTTGRVTPEQLESELKAGARKISIVELRFGLDVVVTPEQITAVRAL